MGSNKLPFGLSSGRQQTNSCTEQYDWQQLTRRQREHAIREQPHCGATLNYPPSDTYSRDMVEDSVTATEISCRSRGYYDSHRSGRETVNNICYSRSETDFNKWNQLLDQPGLLVLKRYRRSTSPRCGVKRTGESSTFYDHKHSLEIPYPGNGIGAPRHLSSCSYNHLFKNKIGEYHGQGHAYHSHSSKQSRRSFSHGPAPISSYRTERRSPSFDRVHDYAIGANGHMHITVRHEKGFPFNHGSSTRDRHYQEDQYLTTKVDFPSGHFSEIDEARHQSYIDNFHIYKKHKGHFCEDPTFNISARISAGRSHHRDELGGPHTKKPSDEFKTIHHEQLELSPSEDFHDYLDSSRNCRNGYNGKMLRRKWPKRRFQENSNGVCVSKHGRNSRWKKYGDHLAELKAKNNVAYLDQSNVFCYLNEQYQQPYPHDEVHNGGSDVMRNDNREGNDATSKEVGQNGAKGYCHPKKNILTAVTCSGSTKSDENSDVFSPKYSSKTIASSNVTKQGEGSSNMKLESDKWLSDIGCTKSTRNMRTEEVSRGNLQHPPVTYMEKGVHTKESDNISPSEVLRDCLSLWRRLRKDSGAEADKVMETHKIGTVQTSRVSIGRRVRNGRASASGSSESDDENESASECVYGSSERDDESDSSSENSEQRRKAMSYGIQKCGEGRAKRKSKQPFGCHSGSNRNKGPQNTMAEQGLKCNLEFPPEANPGEITQQKEQDKHSCCQLSAAQPDAKIQTSRNNCSDKRKVDQAAATHPDSSVRQNVSQHEATNGHLDARRKYKLGVSCEIKKKVEGNGAKWAEQMASSSTGPTLLDQNTVALCSMHDDNLKVNAGCSNQDSKSTTTFSAPNLDKGTTDNCAKKPVNWSSGSACRDIQNLSKGNDCRDIQWDTMNCNILKNKQEFSALADSGNNMRQAEKDSEPPQALEVPTNQQISHQFDSDRTNSGVARRADWISCCAIPDLNSLPSMDTNEEFRASEEVIYQISGCGSKPHDASKKLSAPFSGPTVDEELFKQPEPNELIRGICEREGANSHSGPPQVSKVGGSSESIDAFKCALCEFIKNILKPLWEDGLLSRQVHKIIVKKAVNKVTVVLGPKIPVTEIAICRFLSEESQSVEKLVEGYLDVYVGRQVLKRTMPDNI